MYCLKDAFIFLQISNFTATLISGFEALCTADPADLMTVPPDLNFDFANFHQKLCAVNLTILGEESMRYNSQDNITRAVRKGCNGAKLRQHWSLGFPTTFDTATEDG